MEVSHDSQNSIVFESSSQDPSNSGIVFMADDDSVGTGSQAEGKQRGAHGMMLTIVLYPRTFRSQLIRTLLGSFVYPVCLAVSYPWS